MSKIKDFVTQLEDDEFYSLLEELGKEYKLRILNLILSKGITSITFGCESKLFPSVCVETSAGWRYIKVETIGYDKGSIDGNPLGTNLYVLDSNSVMHWGSAIDDTSLGEIYNKLRDI